MEAIQILCLRVYLKTPSLSYFRGFLSILGAFFAFQNKKYRKNIKKMVINDQTQNFKTVLIEKRYSAWHKNTNILFFF